MLDKIGDDCWESRWRERAREGVLIRCHAAEKGRRVTGADERGKSDDAGLVVSRRTLSE